MAEVPEALRAALSDRYTLQDELGRGGMATVYRAQDLRRDRCVALKVLHAEVAAAVGRERFLREIEVVKRLNHPHILPLLDSGEAGAFLYYAMPCVEGESLQDRIAREGQLPLADVIAIARDVALGLAHAHQHGIVHRDVKPGNILLSGRSAVIADFGIARVLGQAADEGRLTTSGLTVGTPLYMAPEQAASAKRLDGRADLYSLACVVYEMLAGVPPFTGSTTQAIQARHALDPPPPLHTVRPGVPPAVERAVLQGLAKVPADRLATTVAFVEALTAPDVTPHRRTTSPGWRRWAIAAAGGIALAGAVALVAPRVWASLTSEPDTTRYAVLPFKYEQGITPLNEDQTLRDAFSRWSGITLVDPFHVRDAMDGRAGGNLTPAEALRVARSVRAGRFVRAAVSRAGDSIRIRGFVYDATRRGVALQSAVITLSARRLNLERALRPLADSLLFRGTEPPPQREIVVGTPSYPARQAFARGHRAIEQWDLAAADTAFAQATTYDPRYAQAHLWLAQVRAWNAAPPVKRGSVPTWRSAAERAAAGIDRLSSPERLMANALVALARNDLAYACSHWRRLVRSDSLDFAAWYGFGSCLASDDGAVRDRRSPSGWSFRSSYHEATRAYQRAYLLLPSIHRALSAESYQSVRTLLWTNTNVLRSGRATPPDSGTFESYAEWQGDTLAFVPRVMATPAPTTLIAERRQRQMFHETAQAWVAAYPASHDAMYALALSLEMLRDPAALDTMRRAASLAATPGARVLVTAAGVWMRIRLATPDDLDGLAAARNLADSLLRANPPPEAPHAILLASLAALLGQGGRAAAYMRETSVRADWFIPGPLARSAAPLLVFAALGGPVDSLRTLERELTVAISRVAPDEERLSLKAAWLARAASLAFPHYRLASLEELSGLGDYLVDAQAAFARGNVDAVRKMADSIAVVRRTVPPERRTLDGLYPEAALLAESGETARAIAWLDPTLNAIAGIAPQLLDDPVMAGSFVRAMVLRSELAAATGDHAAATRWGSATRVLWSDADAFLHPPVESVEHPRRQAAR